MPVDPNTFTDTGFDSLCGHSTMEIASFDVVIR